MEQLIEFVGNHLILVIGFLIVSAMLAQNIYADLGSSGNLSPQQATEKINREDAIVVDVRPMADFNKGHILGAKNFPMNGLMKQVGQLEKHKKDPIIVSCRSGAQSSMACKQLRKAGFENVFNLRGGILAWGNANLPISRK
jgi:rhodanese-related sulfurtransferase